MRQNKPFSNFIGLIKKIAPNVSIEHNGSRGHKVHVRIKNNFLLKDLKKIKEITITDIRKAPEYSRGYETIFILHKNQQVPVVISGDRDTKINSQSILQKELAPEKLGIVGSYSCSDTLCKDVVNKLKSKKPKPTLNQKALSYIKDPKEDDLLNLLIKLCYLSKDCSLKLSKKEKEVYKICRSSIDKDFGECLTAINLLASQKYEKVTFNKKVSGEIYDLETENKRGQLLKVDVKTGGGSGKSFKSISKRQVDSLINDNNFTIGSDGYLYSQLIKILNSDVKGDIKILKAADLMIKTKHKKEISNLLNKIKERFFNNDLFKNLNINNNCLSFYDYKKEILGLLKKSNIEKKVGVPRGAPNKKEPNETLSVDEMKKCLLFTISTFIANFHDQECFDDIMKNFLVNQAIITHFHEKNGYLIFETPKKINYSLHYWGNVSAPTNNMIGYKAVY